MTLPVLLVAGAAGVGKSAVVASLTSRSADAPAHAEQRQQAGDGPDAVWRIDNKYYKAAAVVREVGVAACGMQRPPQQHAADALMLVVSCDAPDSFHAIQAWADAAPAAMDADMKLLLANKADLLPGVGTPARPAWLEAAMEWCAGSGVEYIEVCASDSQVDLNLELDGDQQGIIRVEQALHAHMWPGMVMKPRRGGAGGGGTPATGNAAEVPEHDLQDAAQDVERHSQDQDAVELGNAAAAADGDVSMAWLSRVAEERGEVLDNDGNPADAPQSNEAAAVEEFDKVFSEMQVAKQRLAGLPDAERRAGAAAMAMRLASMLGLEDDDDSGAGSSADEQ